jgi:hypothetical protein
MLPVLIGNIIKTRPCTNHLAQPKRHGLEGHAVHVKAPLHRYAVGVGCAKVAIRQSVDSKYRGCGWRPGAGFTTLGEVVEGNHGEVIAEEMAEGTESLSRSCPKRGQKIGNVQMRPVYRRFWVQCQQVRITTRIGRHESWRFRRWDCGTVCAPVLITAAAAGLGSDT